MSTLVTRTDHNEAGLKTALGHMSEREFKTGVKWQYLAIEFPYNQLQKAMNSFSQLGMQGFELTTVIPGVGSHTAIFKRRSQEKRK